MYKYYKYLLFYNINMGRLRNRIANTLGIAPRTVKTAARTTMDTTKSALNLVLDPFIGLWKTWLSIKDAIHKSFTEGPRYHRLRKVPTSLALSPLMAIEWVVETLRWTWVNACSSARDIIWNTLTNEGKAIKMMWKSEKFQFSTEKLEYKNISPRNRLAGLFKPKTEVDIEREQFKSREKSIKYAEDKLRKEKEDRKKEREKRRNDIKVEQEKSRKEREDRRNNKKAEQEKSREEKDELRKTIDILEKRNKELESALKNTKAETAENKWEKAEIIKLNPQTQKIENNSENKEVKVVKLEPKQDGKKEIKLEWKPDSKETSESPELKEAA